MARHGIKKPPSKQGARILTPEPRPANDMAPAFGFYTTMPGFGLDALDREDLLAFLDAVRRRSQMTWSQLWANHHKKLGIEMLPQSAIRVPKPAWMRENHVVLVIRCGGLRRMIGVRNGRIFEAVWLDCDGRVYDHGD